MPHPMTYFASSFSRPTFTGKETDCETGFSYFGARYYDLTLLTSWTAVDPMSDKYPSLSPYNYCAWNPMKFVDPNGCDTFSVNREGYIEWIGKSGTDILQGTDQNGNKVHSAAMTKGTFYYYAENNVPIDGGDPITGFECELRGTKNDRMVAFKFLSQITDVEWSLFSVENTNNGEIQYWLTNSHDSGERIGSRKQRFDNYGTTLIESLHKEGYRLISRIHNHEKDPNPSNPDKKYTQNKKDANHYIFCSRTQSFSKIELSKWDGFIMVGENEIKGL